MKIKNVFVVAVLLVANTMAFCNTSDSVFRQSELKIAGLAEQLFNTRLNNKRQDTLNQQLKNELASALNLEGSMQYPFDSLKYIGHVTSTDGAVRIFTYNYVRENGDYEHVGFLQYYSKESKNTFLYQLTDAGLSLQEPENVTLSHENWYGALYYQIVETKFEGEKYYTLIGLNGNNLYSRKKVIDLLYFTSSDKPKFGKAIFVVGKRKQRRLIFEFSRMANMMVKYDAKLDMIVLDHLAPESTIHTGDFKHYGPDWSYDGLKFNNGQWEFVLEIDYKPEKTKRSKP